MKSIGVIILVYNTEKYLVQCVESVLNQDYNALQVVLVDDGSNDVSGKICDDFALKDSRVRVIHQENKGKIESRYIGASNLETDYITFVDSDDWIEEDTYSSVCELMEREIDIISYKIIRYKSADYQIKSEGNLKDGIFYAEKYRDIVCSTMIWDEKINCCGVDPSLCNKLIKREVIMPQLNMARKICIGYGDDAAVVFPTLYNANSYAMVDEYKYYHRKRPNQEVPDYFLDEEYYYKLSQLYDYLRDRFENDENYVRQLDMFFAHSAEQRLQKYGVENQINRYIAPFDKINKDSRVILYGAGKVGQSYYKQITELGYCEIVAWVDKNKTMCDGVTIADNSVFVNVEFDYVVIAIKSEDAANEIIQMLLEQYSIATDKIIWDFHEYYM